LAPDVVAMTQSRKSSFIAIGVLFQAFNTFLNQPAESGTDFKSLARIRGSVFQRHSKLHGKAVENNCQINLCSLCHR